MEGKFKVGDMVDVKNAGVGMVEQVREIYNPLTFEFTYRYRIMFYGGYIRYHNEDELELYVEKACETPNNVIQDSAIRPCYYLGDKAIFHRWVDETKTIIKFDGTIRVDKFKEIKQTYEEHGIIYPGMDVLPVVNTFALIEVADGSMKKVPPEEIRFITDKELFCKER